MSPRTARLAPLFALVLFSATSGIGVRDANALPGSTLPTVPAGFSIETIAHVGSPRELAVTPNGDLLIGTSGKNVEIVPGATGVPGAAHDFVRLPDGDAAGVALGAHDLFVGTYGGVWRVPYAIGNERASAPARKITSVRTLGGRGHTTTSVALGPDALFASVGSSCNVCVETDPTRATILAMTTDGRDRRIRATHIRNAIALAIDPRTGTLWAGVAGQDELPQGHPYEIFDAVGARPGTPDYGWPTCYENRIAVNGTTDCSGQTVPRAVFPAYETPIGATFSTAPASAPYAFGAAYRDGAFVTLHGSWHSPPVPPRVVFIPMDGDEPTTHVDWHDPHAQWKTFIRGFQHDDGSRVGRPTGIAFASDGTLFVADDGADVIYRIRPKRRS